MTTPEQARRKRLGRWITWGLVALFATLTVGVPLYVTFGPDPPIRVSKETTHLTSPLTPEGLPDYAAAMLADLRRGVTPENNGAAPFVQAMWDELLNDEYEEWSEQDAELICQDIGVACPPPLRTRGSDYDTDAMRLELLRLYKSRVPEPTEIIPYDEVAQANNLFGVGTDEETFWGLPDKEACRDMRIEDLLDASMSRAWTRKDLPCLADWVEQNDASLDLLVEGAARSHWFLPAVGLLSEHSDPLALLPVSMTAREASRRLSLRSHLHLGEKRYAEAIRDITAILRFGRHLCQERLLVSQMIGSAIHGVGLRDIRELASDEGAPASVLRRLLDDLQAIGPGVPDVRRSLVHERYFGLASIVTSGRDASSDWDWFEETDSLELVKRFSIDWNEVLIAINGHYDSLEMAFKQPTPARVLGALRQVDAQIAARSAAHEEFAEHPQRLLTPAQRGQAVANQYMASSFLASEDFYNLGALARARYDLTLLGVALTIWRAENGGEYPESLDALTPSVLTTLPTDAFGVEPYQYRRTEDGFLLHSVGPNGVDDGGSSTSDGFYPKHEGVEIEVSDDDSAPTPEEKALMDRLELIPEGADDVSVRFPLPVTPWPWEKASQEKAE